MNRWRPTKVSSEISKKTNSYNQALTTSRTLGDHESADKALSRLLSPVAPGIVDREGLPHIAHLICGWGNARVRGIPLIDYVSKFAIQSVDRKLYIAQSQETGDFHPWQTFAYCVMADHALVHANCGTIPLGELAANSSDLNTSNNTDLGHFLYAYSNLPHRYRPKRAVFDRRSRSVRDLVDIAIEGHFYGGFEVCRKFHLTEGLCAITTLARFAHHRSVVETFVNGQLDC
jgi:hypothetical protein